MGKGLQGLQEFRSCRMEPPKICTTKGLEDSAQGFNQVSTLGTDHLKRRALTRRYLVAPCWKNTQSAGLEVLNGRQIDSSQP
jgi:hypothetical protein